ncbi:hypothetical protein PCE1_000930 [Barthelona sp. PCE]
MSKREREELSPFSRISNAQRNAKRNLHSGSHIHSEDEHYHAFLATMGNLVARACESFSVSGEKLLNDVKLVGLNRISSINDLPDSVIRELIVQAGPETIPKLRLVSKRFLGIANGILDKFAVSDYSRSLLINFFADSYQSEKKAAHLLPDLQLLTENASADDVLDIINRLSQVHTLDLRNISAISRESLIFAGSHLTSLQDVLICAGASVSDDVLLSLLASTTVLKGLFLNNCIITHKAIAHILLSNQGLKYIGLDNCPRLKTKSLKVISLSPNIEKLGLSQLSVTEDDIDQLVHMKKLRHLSLVNLKDVLLVSLFHIPLVSLLLSHLQLDNSMIADIPSTLEYFEIDSCTFTHDATIVSLIVRQCPNLKHLTLHHMNINPRILKEFLVQLKALECIDVRHTNLQYEEVQYFLPSVYIIADDGHSEEYRSIPVDKMTSTIPFSYISEH